MTEAKKIGFDDLQQMKMARDLGHALTHADACDLLGHVEGYEEQIAAINALLSHPNADDALSKIGEILMGDGS